MKPETLTLIAWAWMAVAAGVHIAMFYITAPFGRHTSEKWGPVINNKLGWIIMEFPSFAIMLYFLLTGPRTFSSYVWILFGCWLFHYLNRTFIYPARIRSTPKKMPLIIALSAVFFNCMNAGLNGYYLSTLADPAAYAAGWLHSPRFIAGMTLFIAGLWVNWHADTMLINLRRPGESGYKIPQGFLFDYVSSPNLFGEIIEWSGFALMAWNLPAATFLVWTLANLVPRAKNHHDWYLRTFPDYPKKRKVIFPFIF